MRKKEQFDFVLNNMFIYIAAELFLHKKKIQFKFILILQIVRVFSNLMLQVNEMTFITPTENIQFHLIATLHTYLALEAISQQIQPNEIW